MLNRHFWRVLLGVGAAAIALFLAAGHAPVPAETKPLATNVSGDVSGTWTLANSPYLAVGHLHVPAGNTLNIDPGVQVRVGNGWRIAVDGTLNPNGTSGQPINIAKNSAEHLTGRVSAAWRREFLQDNGIRNIGGRQYRDGREAVSSDQDVVFAA